MDRIERVRAMEKAMDEVREAIEALKDALGRYEDAQDMAQEAFLKAYSSLNSFRGDSKFSSWLYRIVSNVCLDFKRRQGRRPQSPGRHRRQPAGPR